MSRNVDTVKAICDCVGSGDIAGILARLAPDVEWEHDCGGAPRRRYQPRRGHYGVLQSASLRLAARPAEARRMGEPRVNRP